MAIKFAYAIQFVSDMDQSIHFYRDVLGFNLLFQSPEWTEFATGETRLALHPASEQNPAGKMQVGFHVPNLQEFVRTQSAQGLIFTQAPRLEGGTSIARFKGPDGIEYSISESNGG